MMGDAVGTPQSRWLGAGVEKGLLAGPAAEFQGPLIKTVKNVQTATAQHQAQRPAHSHPPLELALGVWGPLPLAATF